MFCSCILGSRIVNAADAVRKQNLVEKDGKRDALAAVVTAKREVENVLVLFLCYLLHSYRSFLALFLVPSPKRSLSLNSTHYLYTYLPPSLSLPFHLIPSLPPSLSFSLSPSYFLSFSLYFFFFFFFLSSSFSVFLSLFSLSSSIYYFPFPTVAKAFLRNDGKARTRHSRRSCVTLRESIEGY